ncbi:MAG: hypothetical protein H6696_14185 [Deferribacteres bacterium]|nr:hypothetical protein [candidate division KSB1 bacterium]MCB9503077.1 hypothetical protein [Deferribacteres bacterium]
MTELKELLSALSLLQWTLIAICWLISNGIVIFVAGKWFWRKERRLYRNLKRPIMIITPTNENNGSIPGTNMAYEKKLLSDNGFFRIDGDVCDYKAFNPNNNHCIVVLGYHKEMDGIGDVLTKIKSLHIPLIIYTYGKNVNAITESHKKEFDRYPFILYANFHLTLINHIFTTLATYPFNFKQ